MSIGPNGYTHLPSPTRMIFPHTPAGKWNDYAKMNSFLSRAIFPSMSYEYQTDFNDRTDTGRAFVFERVVFADRAAAFRGKEFQHTWRTASEALLIPGSKYWWTTVRKNLLEFVGAGGNEDLEIEFGIEETEDVALVSEIDVVALEAEETDLEEEAEVATEAEPEKKAALFNSKPVITYVSRQDWGRRMLKPKDHESLVHELAQLEKKYGWEVSNLRIASLVCVADERVVDQHCSHGQALARPANPTGGTNDNHDGRSRQWTHTFTLDERPEPTFNGHRVLLPRRFRRRLRVHIASSWNQALWCLG